MSGPSEEQYLWECFRNGSDQSARTRLIEHFYPLVKTIAAKLYANRPSDDVGFGDYYQFGMVGLIESVDRYRVGTGASFETFSSYRIRGAILDGIQKLTERREQEASRTRLRKERIRSIVDEEPGKKPGLFDEMVDLALGLAIGYMLEDSALYVESNRVDEARPYRAKELEQLRERLLSALETLPERERLIVEAHYFWETGFDALTERMGVSKGRVSQLHKRALQMLRHALSGRGEFDDSF